MTQEILQAPSKTKSLPKGVTFIIGNEAAERFSFYGMKGILVVFMTSHLWLMGSHASSAPMSASEARTWYHLFTGSVYLTPFLGAILADAWLGKYRTIMLLSCVYCVGHGLLALVGLDLFFSNSFSTAQLFFMLGLGTIALGSGGIKPCVSAHVGDQFGTSNAHWITKVFGWFYVAINLGAFTSNLLTPWLLKWYGPHWAFGVPGVLMALATLTFFLGRKRFVHVPPQGKLFFKEAFGTAGLKALAKLSLIYAFVAVFWALFDQTGSSWVLQAENMNRSWLGVTWLESQIQAINPIMILVFVPLFSFVLYPTIERIFKLTPLRKIGIGLFVMVPGFAIVALTQEWIDAGERPSIAWQVLAYVILTASEVMVSITCLEFSYTQAPKRMKSLVMATFLASVTLGNFFTMGVNWFVQVDAPKPSSELVELIVLARERGEIPDLSRLASSELDLGDYTPQPEGGFALNFQISGQEAQARYADSGELISMTTAGAAQLESLSNRMLAASEGTSPWVNDSEAKALLQTELDQWGRPLQFNVLNASHACLSSSGKDTVWNTEDDLNYHLRRRTRKSGNLEKDWLALRKEELGIVSQGKTGDAARSFDSELVLGGGTQLEGAAYFWFFTLLMLGTAICFIPLVCLYRPETHLQDEV